MRVSSCASELTLRCRLEEEAELDTLPLPSALLSVVCVRLALLLLLSAALVVLEEEEEASWLCDGCRSRSRGRFSVVMFWETPRDEELMLECLQVKV